MFTLLVCVFVYVCVDVCVEGGVRMEAINRAYYCLSDEVCSMDYC